MRENFLCKIEGRLGGDFGDLKEVRLLRCVIWWAPSGLKHEADPRRAEQPVRDLLMAGSGPAANGPSFRTGPLRPVSFPGYKRDPTEEEAAEPL
eukprot:2098639-Alexandrium_andersonii.AAC.1